MPTSLHDQFQHLPHFEWRGAFQNDEVNALHAECFEHAFFADDWWGQVDRFSLGWVTMRASDRLAGFINVAWDGGVHVFLLDTMVSTAHRHHGYGTRLVQVAVENAKASRCEWLHVDFDRHLRDFYYQACGFKPTDAGLIQLR